MAAIDDIDDCNSFKYLSRMAVAGLTADRRTQISLKLQDLEQRSVSALKTILSTNGWSDDFKISQIQELALKHCSEKANLFLDRDKLYALERKLP